METLKELNDRLLGIKALSNVGVMGITKGSQYLCMELLNLAINLKKYLQDFESKVEKGVMGEKETIELNKFVESLTAYFTDTVFLHGKKLQTWVDMVNLFFGIAVYHKASMRVMSNKTLSLFFLSLSFESMEKIVYNNMYYVLTDFRN